MDMNGNIIGNLIWNRMDTNLDEVWGSRCDLTGMMGIGLGGIIPKQLQVSVIFKFVIDWLIDIIEDIMYYILL